MGNAIWLFTALPTWFLSAVLSPFSAGAISLVPAMGAICLAIGIVLAVQRRAKALWVFIIPAVISQVFVAIAGFFRGAFISSSAAPILITFLVVQLLLSIFLVIGREIFGCPRRCWPLSVCRTPSSLGSSPEWHLPTIGFEFRCPPLSGFSLIQPFGYDRY